MKIVLVRRVGAVDYDPAIHADLELRKFIFWEDSAYGAPLLIIGTTDTPSHQDLAMFAEHFKVKIPHMDQCTDQVKQPDGAGEIRGSNVASWSSGGYHVFTPIDLRPLILGGLKLNE